MPKNRENKHKMHDKELLGALYLLVFGEERQICVLTLIQEKKLIEEEIVWKKYMHKQFFFKMALHYSRALPLADVRGGKCQCHNIARGGKGDKGGIGFER